MTIVIIIVVVESLLIFKRCSFMGQRPLQPLILLQSRKKENPDFTHYSILKIIWSLPSFLIVLELILNIFKVSSNT